ncbi:hypothetical protein ACUXV3_03835 [Roseobacteraceae bacterium NS-SX3]
MTPSTKDRLDTFFKAAGLAIALFGVGKYFYDLSIERGNQAKARSIAYLDRYNFGELTNSRKALANFWLGRPQFVEVAKSGLMPEDNYRAVFFASLNSMPDRENVWGSIFDFSYYFSEIDHCISSGLCDQQILVDALCSRVIAFHTTYFPALSTLSARVGDTEVLEGVERLKQKCRDS